MKSDRLASFQSTLQRFDGSLTQPPSDVSRDSAILRFQLCFDLAWKCIKDFAHTEGVECYSPKSCLRSAFQLGLISNDTTWMEMVEQRNQVAHVYQEKLAKTLFHELPSYRTLFQSLFEALSKVWKQPSLPINHPKTL